MKKKILAIAFLVLWGTSLVVPFQSFGHTESSTESLYLNVGDSRYLYSRSISSGAIYAYSWTSSDYKAVVIDGSTTNSNCHITVVGNSSKHVIIRCTMYKQTLVGGYIYGGEDFIDFNIYISQSGPTATPTPLPRITVFLNPDGGSVTPSALYYDEGDTYGTLPTPVRPGYKFMGWYRSGQKVFSLLPVHRTVSSVDYFTLFARWEEDSPASPTPTPTATPTATPELMDTPDFVLPKVMTVIKEEAFANIAASVVMLPESVTSIGANAFAYCPNLRQIYIPAGAAIADTAFEGVTNLVIFGLADSSAEAFAKKHGFEFWEYHVKEE